MRSAFERRLVFASLPFLLQSAVHALPHCDVNVATPPVLRGQGNSDYGGDITLVCSGGTPAASGHSIPFFNLQVFFNTFVTSKLLAPNWTETLLLVDEPPPASQLVCGDPVSAPEASPGVCNITGTGTGIDVYKGTLHRPNVFQGRLSGPNSITWTIALDIPAATSRILRITNARVAQSLLGPGPPPGATVYSFISISGPTSILLNSPLQTFGFNEPGFHLSVVSKHVFSACVPEDPNLVKSQGTDGMPQLSIGFDEGFASAWKTRIGAGLGGPLPPFSAQNAPGFVHQDSETDFYNPAFPFIPRRGNLAHAGLADEGTRLGFVLTGVPPGVSLFTPATVITSSAPAGTLQRILTAPLGTGPYAPAPATAGPLVPIPVVGGNAEAVFEVTATNAVAVEHAVIPVYVSYTGTTPASVHAFASMLPIDFSVFASATAPVPRFNFAGDNAPAFTIRPCGK